MSQRAAGIFSEGMEALGKGAQISNVNSPREDDADEPAEESRRVKAGRARIGRLVWTDSHWT